jgi:hypothetical protein
MSVLLAATLLGGCAEADQQTRPAGAAAQLGQKDSSAEAGGRLIVEGEPWRDFGDVSAGDQLQHSVELRSDATEPLEIRVAAKSCPCVDANLDQRSLTPGRSVRLTMRLSAGQSPQQQCQWVQVGLFDSRSDQLRAVARVGLCYRCATEFVVTPHAVTIIARAGAPFEHVVHLRRPGLGSALGVRHVELEGLEGTTVEVLPEAEFVERVRVSGVLDRVGVHRGVIKIHAQTRSERPIGVPVAIRVEDALEMTPRGIIVPGGSVPVCRSVQLRPRIDRPEAIPARIEVSHPSITAMLSPCRREMTLCVNPLAALDGLGGEVRLFDAANRELARCPVSVLPSRSAGASTTAPRPQTRRFSQRIEAAIAGRGAQSALSRRPVVTQPNAMP